MLGHFYGPYRSFTVKNQWTKWCNNIVYLAPTDFQNAVKIIKNITLNAKQKSLTEFLTFLKNITRKSISKLDRVTNFRLLRSTETSLLIGWNLPMSLENNRHAFHNLQVRVSRTIRDPRTVNELLYRVERDFWWKYIFLHFRTCEISKLLSGDFLLNFNSNEIFDEFLILERSNMLKSDDL